MKNKLKDLYYGTEGVVVLVSFQMMTQIIS
jgi:hypothetical protein